MEMGIERSEAAILHVVYGGREKSGQKVPKTGSAACGRGRTSNRTPSAKRMPLTRLHKKWENLIMQKEFRNVSQRLFIKRGFYL